MQAQARFQAAMSKMSPKDFALMASLKKKVDKKAAGINKQMSSGGTQRPANAPNSPYGLAGAPGMESFWDPFSLSAQTTQGELYFFREAEIKHGRVCMLATLGFLVQEQFHPFFGGWDGPALQAVVQKDVLLFWPALFVAIGGLELSQFSRLDYNVPSIGFTPELRQGETPGAVGFDPLNLKPSDPDELLKRQNQEILHGRLSMIAAAGFIAQELFLGQRLTEGGIYDLA